jgi:hypothetical protein
MSDFDADGYLEDDWDGCEDPAWTEFDWERYLREQDDILHRYLAHYERLKHRAERVDEAAHLMGWDTGRPDDGDEAAAGAGAGEGKADEAAPPADGHLLEPYTLHQNPVFIATKAICLSLKRSWELIASDAAKVPQPLALAMQTSLYRSEEHATLGVQALDLGDYAMAVSLFKRALHELNQALSLAGHPDAAAGAGLTAWRADALPRLFDLREIWLRVIKECRRELARRVDDES